MTRDLAETAARWTEKLVNTLNDIKTDVSRLERLKEDVGMIYKCVGSYTTCMNG
jgi:hypothetical protein